MTIEKAETILKKYKACMEKACDRKCEKCEYEHNEEEINEAIAFVMDIVIQQKEQKRNKERQFKR